MTGHVLPPITSSVQMMRDLKSIEEQQAPQHRLPPITSSQQHLHESKPAAGSNETPQHHPCVESEPQRVIIGTSKPERRAMSLADLVAEQDRAQEQPKKMSGADMASSILQGML